MYDYVCYIRVVHKKWKSRYPQSHPPIFCIMVHWGYIPWIDNVCRNANGSLIRKSNCSDSIFFYFSTLFVYEIQNALLSLYFVEMKAMQRRFYKIRITNYRNNIFLIIIWRKEKFKWNGIVHQTKTNQIQSFYVNWVNENDWIKK